MIQYYNINIPRHSHEDEKFQCHFTDINFRLSSCFLLFLRDINVFHAFLAKKRLTEKITLKSHHTNYTRVPYAFLFLKTRSRNDTYILRNILHMPTSITRKALDPRFYFITQDERTKEPVSTATLFSGDKI